MTAVDLTARLDESEARANAATDGPWRWRNTREVYLLGAGSRAVMAFERMGMQGAQPAFRGADGLLYPAGRENINAFPDAVFIAHARTDVPWLIDLARGQDAALRAVLELADAADAAAADDPGQECGLVHAHQVRAAITSALGGAR